MKKLYYCNAQCDENTLYSYKTLIYHYDKDKGYCFNCYRSMTTLSHIRKYIQWLREKGYIIQADRVQGLYNYCIRTHKQFIDVDFAKDYKVLADYGI